MTAKAPICKPINGKTDEPIWVITDTSVHGIGVYYGQGPTWQRCRPAGFLSRKFTPAQMNYCTWEHELLGVLEALLHWKDRLLGIKFMVITDHQALTFFKEAPMHSPHRLWWWEYLSRFDFKIKYLKGDDNKIADTLSHYYANDEEGETHDLSEYARANSRLDPEGDDLTRN